MLFLPLLLSSLLTLSIITLLPTIKLPPPQQINQRSMEEVRRKVRLEGGELQVLFPLLSA